MKLFTSAAASVIFSLLTSCAQKWDDSQKSSLSSVTVSAPVIAGDAYRKPVGKIPTAGAVPVTAPAGSDPAAAAVGGALAQLIIEGIGVAQQSMYEKANSDAISRAAGTVPRDLSERIRQTVARELNTKSFFRGKVRDASSNRLIVKVDSYGYVRTSKVQGKICMAPQFTGSFELLDANGKSLLKQVLIAGAASESHPLEEFTNNPKLASKAFDTAIGQIASQISTAVDRQAGVKP